MADMNVWLQLVLTLAAVAGVVLAGGRWALRGFEARVGAVVRAETAPQFDRVDARFAEVDERLRAGFAEVDGQLVELRHQVELAHQRLGSVEGDMTLVKQRLLGTP